MSTRNISWGVKAAGAWGWRPHHLHMPNIMEIWEPKPPGTLWATPDLLWDSLTLYIWLEPMIYKNIADISMTCWPNTIFSPFQSVVLATAIISRMVLARPGYVPAHTIDYYVSTIHGMSLFAITPPEIWVAYDLRLKSNQTLTEQSKPDLTTEIKFSLQNFCWISYYIYSVSGLEVYKNTRLCFST